MKTMLMVFLIMVSLLSATATLACATYKDSAYDTGCGSGPCNYNMFPESCSAADRGYIYNDCIDQCDYIRVFGNIGAM